uniref:Uncharacterized protein n=1 Tax=Glossina pallidipes TaxID=7398 RepID=A0A1B0AE16_GLOPL
MLKLLVSGTEDEVDIYCINTNRNDFKDSLKQSWKGATLMNMRVFELPPRYGINKCGRRALKSYGGRRLLMGFPAPVVDTEVAVALDVGFLEFAPITVELAGSAAARFVGGALDVCAVKRVVIPELDVRIRGGRFVGLKALASLLAEEEGIKRATFAGIGANVVSRRFIGFKSRRSETERLRLNFTRVCIRAGFCMTGEVERISFSNRPTFNKL